MTWSPYAPGQIIAGVQILKAVKLAETKKGMLYRILYTCCGTEDTLSHQRIDRRRGSNTRRCIQCGKYGKVRRRPDDTAKLEFPPPTWPVPNI